MKSASSHRTLSLKKQRIALCAASRAHIEIRRITKYISTYSKHVIIEL